VQFLLWNAEMLPVMDIMAEGLAGFLVKIPESREISVSAVIPRNELNGGRYSLSVIAASPDYDRIYCRHDNAVSLQIDAESASGAHVISIASWSSLTPQS
jgi:hypothetical protein